MLRLLSWSFHLFIFDRIPLFLLKQTLIDKLVIVPNHYPKDKNSQKKLK